MFLFVSSSFLLLLILQCISQFLNENRQNFVQGVHHTSLKPLRNCRSCVVEAELLQDVVHSHWIDLPACPGNQPETFINQCSIIQCPYGKPEVVCRVLFGISRQAWIIKLDINRFICKLFLLSVYTRRPLFQKRNPEISEYLCILLVATEHHKTNYSKPCVSWHQIRKSAQKLLHFKMWLKQSSLNRLFISTPCRNVIFQIHGINGIMVAQG